MAGFDLPVRAIREQIASAVDCIVQIERMRDGSRKVICIYEVVGMEGDIVTMQEIVRYQQRGVDHEVNVVGEFHVLFGSAQLHDEVRGYGVDFDVRSLAELTGQPAGVAGFFPYAVFIGAAGAVAILFVAFWGACAALAPYRALRLASSARTSRCERKSSFLRRRDRDLPLGRDARPDSHLAAGRCVAAAALPLSVLLRLRILDQPQDQKTARQRSTTSSKSVCA